MRLTALALLLLFGIGCCSTKEQPATSAASSKLTNAPAVENSRRIPPPEGAAEITARKPPTSPANQTAPISTEGQDSRRVPLLHDVAEISVIAGGASGWSVRIWKHGSGCLAGSATLGAGFPPNTFDFREVYDSLAAKVQSVRPSGEYFSVGFVTVTNAGYASTFWTHDADAIRLIFDTAKRRSVAWDNRPGDADSFEKLWRERPPFSK